MRGLFVSSDGAGSDAVLLQPRLDLRQPLLAQLHPRLDAVDHALRLVAELPQSSKG